MKTKLEEKQAELDGSIEELTKKAAGLIEKMEAADDKDTIADVKSQMESVEKDLAPLQKQYVENIREKEMADMKASLTTLGSAISDMKEGGISADLIGSANDKAAGVYGEGGQRSFFSDVKAARRGDRKAMDRLEESYTEDQKAMVENDDSQGGFLVPEQTLGGLVGLRDQLSVVRGLVNVVSVNGDTVRIASQTSGLLAGWVAELAEKPLSDMRFGEVDANVFTAAGMSVASNQLLADSKYSIDQLIFNDLAKRLNTVEEVAIINGTGIGQPKGILNTEGVDIIDCATLITTDPMVLLDKIVDAISEVYTDHLAAPSAILMHPRVWAEIIKARNADDIYLVGPGSSPFGRRPNDSIPGLAASPSPVGSLFGVDVYCSANVPLTLGEDSNETAVIVGDFSEGLILDRQGITTDQSEHVFFTSNQTIFRAEERMGFTAARDPKAFKVIGGEGLVIA